MNGDSPHSQATPHWQQLKHWLQLFHIPGLGPTRYQKLLTALGSPEQIFAASTAQLKTLLPESLVKAITLVERNTFVNAALENTRRWLESSEHHHILTLDNSLYPSFLKMIHDPPPILFVDGDAHVLSNRQMAIVGSRKPSYAAVEVARRTGTELAEQGLTVTSGLALGIDGAAHQGALQAEGPTVAVLAGGVDCVYPHRHRPLAKAITEHGAVVSEFALGTQPKSGHFPRRNRIISGLSVGVLVVEAAIASGSLVTARCALEQGREVFAMPGSVNNPGVRGCHKLIREGACLVENTAQILEELSGVISAEKRLQTAFPELQPECPEQQKVLELIGFETCHHDELILRSGMESHTLSEVLLHLELGGFVKTVAGGFARV
ncbi:DNA-processing protein DprA [Sansalvadorimonas verongulae]|uniref:DNA-processing protein DprA n=1 Tax=Sansalvadorimonas verongulae TaxID=2172824 RepID=UPI0012BD67F1|nr:DNA-processing protein DprA [Sansalvadorimonas verongulae]MTI14190.1 DNA-protecting protein DprA [Sansalvadorimonas verongulae]